MALYEGWFYNGCIRKMTIAFASLFTNIFVDRKSADGTTREREIVPITYAAKEKFIQRITQDPNLDRKTAIKLPHMAFDIVNYGYDPERKVSSKRRISDVDKNDVTKAKFFYTPVPYNIDFNLYLITKSQDEGLQIVEQILPYFTPDYTITLRLSDLDSYKQDMPITLLSVKSQDSFEGNFDERRTLIWTLTFRMKGYILGPERSQSRIMHTHVNVYVDGEVQPFVSNFQQLDANLVTTSTFGVVSGIEGSVFDLTTSLNDGKTLMFDVNRNQTFKFLIEVSDQNGVMVSLENFNRYASFRKNFSHPGVYPINTKIGLAVGTLECEIPAETTAPLEPGLYIGSISIENAETLAVNRVVEFILNIR